MALRKRLMMALAILITVNAADAIGQVSTDPDRVLYELSLNNLRESRFTSARLTLQTLINTYPDSEYLERAKFTLAESFYKEGTLSSYAQALTEFRDYLTFFPTSWEADMAQYFVATIQIKLAEIELNRFIETYPGSPKIPEMKQRLAVLKSLPPAV